MSQKGSLQVQELWVFVPDENPDQVCVSSTLSVLLYTASTFMIIMFNLIASQVNNTRKHEMNKLQAEEQRIQELELEFQNDSLHPPTQDQSAVDNSTTVKRKNVA